MLRAAEGGNIGGMALSSVAELKLLYHLMQRILSGQLRTFAELVEYSRTLKSGVRLESVLEEAFRLQRGLYWGFFRDLDRSGYTRLWKELVVPHKDYPAAGDLKRNISISNIYIAMLDIHGYTRFCQESKSNLSRLRKLDEFLHDGIRRIAGANCALANRERGDEIVVVASSASDILKTTLGIIDSFSKRGEVKAEGVKRMREAYSVVLPDFKVTAGIAGGNLTTPLIITQSGLLSGFLLNTAARLQSLANEYAPRDSKIMITNSVHASFVKENRLVKRMGPRALEFFSCGAVSFKGTKVAAYEVIFREQDRYRLKYAGSLAALYESVRQELWTGKVFSDFLETVIQAARAMSSFSVRGVTNASLIRLCDEALKLWAADEFLGAAGLLSGIVEQLERVMDFDPLIVRYGGEIQARYRMLAERLEGKLLEEVEEKLDSVFSEQYKAAYVNSRKYFDTYEKLKSFALNSRALTQKKNLWNALIKERRDELHLEIYSGKR